MRYNSSPGLIGLSQWPQVSASYLITLQNEKPVLCLSLHFDHAVYVLEGDRLRRRAEDDLLVYFALYSQLQTLSPGITCSTTLENSSDGDGSVHHLLSREALLSEFIAPIIDYLTALINGSMPVSVAAFTITCPLEIGALLQLPAVMEINTCFCIKTEAAGNMQEDCTYIPPLLQAGNNNGKPAIHHFVQQLEQALAAVATGKTIFKVAVSDEQQPPVLLLARFGLVDTQAIGLEPEAAAAQYYAPAAFGRQPLYFTAGTGTYSQGTAFPASHREMSFYGFDTDLQLQFFLAAIDAFLDPAYLIPALLLKASGLFGDDPDYIEPILLAREQLIVILSERIVPLAAGAEKAGSEMRNAWKELLSQRLANASGYSTSVQQPVKASSVKVGYTGKGTVAASCRLKGTMQPADPSVPYNVNAGSILLSADTQLAYSILPAKAAEHYRLSCSGLQYVPTGLTLCDDTGETLLDAGFLIPLQPIATIGDAEIPVPLRTCPMLPRAHAPALEQPPGDTIAAVRNWSYLFSYEDDIKTAQDTAVITVQFNTLPSAFSQTGEPDAFNKALAQFAAVYPAVRLNFENDLAGLKAAMLKPGEPQAVNAHYALLAFTAIVNEVMDVLPDYRQPAIANDDTAAFRCRIVQGSEEGTGHLLTELQVLQTSVHTSQAQLLIPGYTHEPVDGTALSKYYRLNAAGEKEYLLYNMRLAHPGRRLVLSNLDIFQTQSAVAGIVLERNRELLPLPAEKGWQPVNEAFALDSSSYTTPLFIPLLDNYEQPIDISSIATTNYPVKPGRSHVESLLALFDALTTPHGKTAMDDFYIRVQCTYRFSIEGSDIQTELPVGKTAMQLISIADCGKPVAAALAEMIARFETAVPSRKADSYLFNITVGSYMDSEVPVMQLYASAKR